MNTKPLEMTLDVFEVGCALCGRNAEECACEPVGAVTATSLRDALKKATAQRDALREARRPKKKGKRMTRYDTMSLSELHTASKRVSEMDGWLQCEGFLLCVLREDDEVNVELAMRIINAIGAEYQSRFGKYGLRLAPSGCSLCGKDREVVDSDRNMCGVCNVEDYDSGD